MSKKVLIRKQMGGVTQQVMVDQSKPRTDARSDLATLRGGAYGLNPDTGRQGFIPGAQLTGAAPTRMQRLGAGANLAGRGLAAALTGLQTAYGLQGGNVGALGSVKDQYRANVGGLTGGSPTEAQQGQNMAMDELARQNAEAAKNTMMQQVNQAPANQSGPTGNALPSQTTTLGQLPPVPTQTPQAAQPAGLPAPPVPAQAAPPQAEPPQAASVDPVPPIAQAMASMPNMGTPPSNGSTQTVEPLPNPQGFSTAESVPVQTKLLQGQPPQPEQVVPQGQPYAGYPVSMMNNNRPINQREYAEWLRQQNSLTRSFATQVLDQFGDMLHKADPHVAGLLAFRVYMDKMMR